MRHHDDPTPDAPTLPGCDDVRRVELALPPLAVLPMADPDMFELRPPVTAEPVQPGRTLFDDEPIF